jgi:hypothetical protein
MKTKIALSTVEPLPDAGNLLIVCSFIRFRPPA